MSDPYVPAEFGSRWLITGQLVTETPLHIGAGMPVERDGLTQPGTVPVAVNTVFRDFAGRPCVPGSSLKGVLRSRMEECLGSEHPAVLALFGKREGPSKNNRREPGTAGRAHFYDARAQQQTLPAGGAPPPFWEDFDHAEPTGRLTGITANVAIRRRTRTAAHQKLFHSEFVPPGIRFDLEIVAQNVDEEHIALLLGALDQFNDAEDRLHLGAKSGNGWGRVNWVPEAVRRMGKEGVMRWLSGSSVGSVRDALEAEPQLEIAAQTLSRRADDTIRLRLKLYFEGPFLVKRPSSPKPKGSSGPNAEPYLDERGRAVLPASSFRGVFRAQAERILRTLAPDEPTALRWAPDPSSKTIEEVRDGELSKLSPVAQVFGATGWRSPVEISDFRDERSEAAPCFEHELVAIDRFTGGAAAGAKFKFKVAWAPVLTGTVSFRRSRWQAKGVDADEWALGLLALVLRDLQQGDLSFGLGAGKGYGRCVRAEFAWFPNATEAVARFQQQFSAHHPA